MDQYVASLARTCLAVSGITNFYTDNVPKNFAVPSLYFPPFESDPSGSALTSYKTEYTIYAKVFAGTRQEAGELAESIVQGIMLMKCLLPVYNENGSDSGGKLKVKPPAMRVIDEGTAQITLEYGIIKAFTEQSVPGASKIGINKNYD